eukprot:6201553-Pleurochrysis_carterae.AAC.2
MQAPASDPDFRIDPRRCFETAACWLRAASDPAVGGHAHARRRQGAVRLQRRAALTCLALTCGAGLVSAGAGSACSIEARATGFMYAGWKATLSKGDMYL